jgi:hypothetical protein
VALVVTDLACALRAKASIHPRVNPWNSAKRLEGKVLKARLASSDMRKGKGKGYRVIYYLSQKENIIYLLTIYAKAYKENISVAEIKEIISRYEL